MIDLRMIGDILLNLGHEELALKTLTESVGGKNGKETTKLTANLAMVLASEIMGDDYLGKRRMKRTHLLQERSGLQSDWYNMGKTG